MEIVVLVAILVAVLNGAAVQLLLFKCLRGEGSEKLSAPCNELTSEELEARKLAAAAQAKYEQGFVNLMCYDGMPGGKKERCL